MDRIDVSFEYKMDDAKGDGYFEGYAAVFGNTDAGGDLILPGAFKSVLASNARFPKMLLQHAGMPFRAPSPEDLIPIGKWDAVSEDSKGLPVSGHLINLDTDFGKRIYGAMKEDEMSGLSIGYRVGDHVIGRTRSDPARTIKSFKALHEISVVTFPMNDMANVSGVKSLLVDMTPIELRELEAALRDGGLSHREAAKAIAGFKAYCRRDAGNPGTDPRDEDAAGLVAALQAAAERIRA